MRIAIVDDEEEQRRILGDFIHQYFSDRKISHECFSFGSAIDFVEGYSVPYDIVFLDIDMPDMDGITVAHRIRKVDAHIVIIFVTRMAQYAIKGYEVNATDFIIKPVRYFNLCTKLNKAIRLVHDQKTFTILSEGRTIILSEDDIYYIEGSNQYVIYHTQQENYKVHASLKGIDGTMSDSFSRCHNSFIINLNYVSRIEGSEAIIGDNRLPISRERKKPFLDDLNRFIGGF